MPRYGEKARDKVEEKMHELKHGQLRSGSGDKVTNPKQAVAIALSQARREGGKVPADKPGAKTGARKTAGKPAANAAPRTAAKKGGATRPTNR